MPFIPLFIDLYAKADFVDHSKRADADGDLGVGHPSVYQVLTNVHCLLGERWPEGIELRGLTYALLMSCLSEGLGHGSVVEEMLSLPRALGLYLDS